MNAIQYSAAVLGVDAQELAIEIVACDSAKPQMRILGLPDASIRETSQRVLSAISASRLYLSDGTKTVNLAPADLKKEGPSFDLPIALAMASASENEPLHANDCYIVGELALDGMVRPVKGVLSIALEAKRSGRTRLLVPEANAPEAAIIDGVHVFGIRSLHQAWKFLRGEEPIAPFVLDRRAFFESRRRYKGDFDEVKGQYHVEETLKVAAAGKHSLLIVGPRGEAASLARMIMSNMPDLSEEEVIETIKIHSAAGLLDSKDASLTTRLFRSPHHTISDAGLFGGGTNPGPGEVSLAHHGVLFLDELPTFLPKTLDTLHQVREDGSVTISGRSGPMSLPAKFLMIGAVSACPCGNLGGQTPQCRCSHQEIETYRQCTIVPLMARFDLCVDMSPH